MTKQKKQLLQYLLLQYIEGVASDPERIQLSLLLEEEKSDTVLQDLIEELFAIEQPMTNYQETEWQSVIDALIMQNRQMEKDGEMAIEEKVLIKPMPVWWRFAAAAVIVFFISTAGYFMFNKKDSPQIAQHPPIQHDVAAPKTTKAMIILADGKQVAVDSISSGTLATQGDVKVIKNADGQIAYQSTDKDQPTALQFNTLYNPRGSKVVNLTLSDGTKVWLNSESSLRYPVAFAEKIRQVEITGEAYFEVSKDASKKFSVSANGSITEVLGTHFNINSYFNESDLKVSLLEGSVNVKKGTSSSAIKPGQQAKIAANGQITILNDVNIEEIMAWKNGYFNFEAADLQTIARQLSRWYDADMVCERKVEDLLYAKIPRDTKLSDVLHALELTGKIKFKIVGKKIIVIP